MRKSKIALKTIVRAIRRVGARTLGARGVPEYRRHRGHVLLREGHLPRARPA